MARCVGHVEYRPSVVGSVRFVALDGSDDGELVTFYDDKDDTKPL